jgi:hypothetical protein
MPVFHQPTNNVSVILRSGQRTQGIPGNDAVRRKVADNQR